MFLPRKGEKFDIRSTDLMAANDGDVGKWMSGAYAVARLPGWSKSGQVLKWVDNGNSWHHLPNVSKFVGRVKEYGTLAATMSKNWEYILYVTAGRTAIPRWESLSDPTARQLHGQIIEELRNYTTQVIFIDEFWIGVRTQHPEFDQSSDKGYHFGYAHSANDPQVNLERAGKLTERLVALVPGICDVSQVID